MVWNVQSTFTKSCQTHGAYDLSTDGNSWWQRDEFPESSDLIQRHSLLKGADAGRGEPTDVSPAPPPARAHVWGTGDVGFKKYWSPGPRPAMAAYAVLLICWVFVVHQANCCLQYFTLVL